jgi:WD40 repeat protein
MYSFTIVKAQSDFPQVQLSEIVRFGSGTAQNNVTYKNALISPDSVHVGVRSNDNIEIWNLETQSLVTTINEPLGVFVWSPDGSHIATITLETELTIWDVYTGEVVKTIEGIDLGSNGTRVIAWQQEDTITTGSFEFLSWNVETEDIPTLVNCHPWGSLLWWSPNGEYIATMGGESTLVWICDSQFRHLISVEGYTTLAWNPDNTSIATVGIFNSLRIWNISSGEAVATSEGGDNNITDIAWHSDGTRLATGHINGEIRIWERLTPGGLWLIGDAHVSGLKDVAWIGDDLITVTDTGVLQMWNLVAG